MIVGIACVILLLLALKNAWFSDDGMITFRTVSNLVNGYGLTWNVDERVQAYTHPLWMLLLTAAYLVTHEIYFTVTIVSLACTCGAFLLIALGVARSQAGILAASAALILAKSFIDFSTSGLENPLSHLLLAAFCVAYLRLSPGRLWLTALIVGMLALNRIDLLVLVTPALAVDILAPVWPNVRADLLAAKGLSARLRALVGLVRLRALGVVALGMLPLVAWELFSLIYYGFLVPNTAYAKLNTGISQSDLYSQGIIYLLSSIRNDPVTLLAISVGLLAPLVARNWRAAALSLGMAFYLVYVVRIGGDFMTGRFLTAPLVVAVALIAADLRVKPAYLLAVFVSAIGLINPRGVLSVDSVEYIKNTAETDNHAQRFHGVIDERAFYFSSRSLAALGRDPAGSEEPTFRQSYQGRNMMVGMIGMIGVYGLTVGPETHIIDPMALSDPLLARLPAAYDPMWRIGHFQRVVPDGYIETLERGVNSIRDKELAAYYDKLHLITSGSLFSPERWAAIWGMHTGAYDDLIDVDFYRYPGQLHLEYAEISRSGADQMPRSLPSGGALINLGGPQTDMRIELMFSHNKRLRVEILRGGAVVHRADLIGPSSPLRPLDLLLIDVPQSAMGYDQIRVLPLEAGEIFLGYLRLIGPGDQISPQFRLSGNWVIGLTRPDVMGRSPASIFVTASEPQPYWLDLTPLTIYEPGALDGLGLRGSLIVQTSAGYTTTVDIEVGKPLSLPLNLPAGSQRIDLSLAAGVYSPTGYIGDSRGKFSFSFSSIRLRTLADIASPLPSDVLINGQVQRAEPGRLIVLFDDGWYRYEQVAGLRWAGPPARLQIYSPAVQSVKLKIPLHYISDGKGPGSQGMLTVVTNGQAAPTAEVWTWQPFVTDLVLQPGWNSVDLILTAPPFTPSMLDGTSTDSRQLSISVEQIELLTEH